MTNQSNLVNTPAPCIFGAPRASLNLAGTPDRVAFVFAKTRAKIADLLGVALNLDAESLRNNALQLVKVARVAFCQNQTAQDAARALPFINSALNSLNNNAVVVKTLEELRANLDAITTPKTVGTSEPVETLEDGRRVENISDVERAVITDIKNELEKLSRCRKDVEKRVREQIARYCEYCDGAGIVRVVYVDRCFKPTYFRVSYDSARSYDLHYEHEPRKIAKWAANYIESTLKGLVNGVYRRYYRAPFGDCAQWDAHALDAARAFELAGKYRAPLMIEAPAPVVVEKQEEETPAFVADDRDALINETFDAITKRIIKASEAVPYMLEKSIKDGCPLWSQKWFSFAELPRKYFDGTLYSVNNMVLMGFHAGFYISESEARRLLGAKIKPDARAIARRVLMPVFKDTKTPNKQELDALRNCEPIADETRTRRPDFYRVEKVYDQTAFEGLAIKKSRELPNNENELNARAEKVLREFCAANNIIFSAVLGLGQAVCEHVENPAAPIRINVPDISQFKTTTAYYSVVFHECTHAANRRNGCQLTKNREELAAEIGACIVLNSLGFDPAEYIDDAGAYVRKFKDTASEKNAIKKAWKYAQASALLILKSFIDAQTTETTEPAEITEEEINDFGTNRLVVLAEENPAQFGALLDVPPRGLYIKEDRAALFAALENAYQDARATGKKLTDYPDLPTPKELEEETEKYIAEYTETRRRAVDYILSNDDNPRLKLIAQKEEEVENGFFDDQRAFLKEYAAKSKGAAIALNYERKKNAETTASEPVETVDAIDGENLDAQEIESLIDDFEKRAELASYTGGIVHAYERDRSERDARAAIQEAREAGLISDARADEIEDQIDAIKRQWTPESAPTSLF